MSQIDMGRCSGSTQIGCMTSLHRILGPLLVLSMLVLVVPTKGTAQLRTDVCTLSETDRQHLHLDDGRSVYVEPRFYERDGTEALLLGHPTYLWRIDETRSELDDQRPFFGVRVHDAGVEPIPNPPVPGAAAFARAVRVGADHLVVLFDVETVGFDGVSVDRQPHVGDLVDGSWTGVEPLPDHEGHTVPSVGLVSNVRSTGAGADVGFAASVGPTSKTVLFTREGGVWSSRQVGVGGVGGLGLADTDGGSVLAEAGWGAVGEPPVLHISHFPGGPDFGVVVDAPDAEAQAPVWSTSGNALAVRVGADGLFRLMVGEPGTDRPFISVDGWTQDLVALSVPGFDASWLMQRTGADGAPYLTFVALDSGGLVRADSPYPFDGPFRAVVRSATPGEQEVAIDLVGPEAQFPPQPAFVRSFMIRMSLSCR